MWVSSAPTLTSHVRRHRQAAGLSQARLAALVGVSRQALSAIEAGASVPSTTLALALSRQLRCTVEDLFTLPCGEVVHARSGSAAPDGRVILGEVDGTIVAHPARPHAAADGLVVAPLDAGHVAVERLSDPAVPLSEHVLVAGCAPLLGVLAARARQHGLHLRWVPTNSSEALALLARGDVHLAGIHLAESHDPSPHHAAAADALGGRAGHLVQLVRWEQGLVVPRGNPHGVADGARLLAPELRLDTRSAGAGAQKLLQRLWQRAGGDGRPQGMVARDHAEVARLVRWGVADTGVAIAAAAQAEGLDFVAVAEERFDLVVSDAHLQQPAIARVVELLGSPSFRAEARRLPGYDPLHAGHVESVGAA